MATTTERQPTTSTTTSGAGANEKSNNDNTNPPSVKRHLNMFSFASTSPDAEQKGQKIPHGIDTSSNNSKYNTSTSPNDLTTQLMSPVISPDSNAAPSADIFERSILEGSFNSPVSHLPKCNKCNSTRSRSCTHNSSISIQGGQFLKQEDCIPAALDASTLVLNDKETNLDEVEMIYSNRRNSSVIGLNMALGRPFTPSRKNSVYSLSSIHQQQQQQQQQQDSQLPTLANSPPRLTQSRSSVSFYSYADMLNNDEFASKRPSISQSSQSQGFVPTLQSLQAAASTQKSTPGANSTSNQITSPPNLRYRSNTGTLERTNSNASTQFSHLSKQLLKQQQHKNNQQQQRQQSASASASPQSSQILVQPPTPQQPQSSQLGKKFLISPESSDNEEIADYGRDAIERERHMSLSSNHSFKSNKSNKSNFSQGLPELNDAESLISTSIGDCLRRTHTELAN